MSTRREEGGSTSRLAALSLAAATRLRAGGQGGWRVVTFLIAVVCCWKAWDISQVFFLRRLGAPVELFDEPLQMVGGMLVRLGQKPFIDFHSVYPPLNYYAIAALFRLWGSSVVAFRTYQYVAVLGTVVAIGWMALARNRSWLAGAFALVLATLASGSSLDSLTSPAVFFAVLALVLYAGDVGAPPSASSNVRQVLAALALSAALLTRLNFGLYVLAAIAGERGVRAVHARRAGGSLRTLFPTVAFLGPLVAVGLLFFAMWHGHWSSIFRQIVVVPNGALHQYTMAVTLDYETVTGRYLFFRSGFFLPLIPGFWLAARAASHDWRRALVPAVVGLASAGLALYLMRVWAAEDPSKLARVALVVTAPLFLVALTHPVVAGAELVVVATVGFSSHYFLSRPDRQHFVSVLPLVAALLPFAWPRWRRAATVLPFAILFFLAKWTVGLEWELAKETPLDIGRLVWKERAEILTKGDQRLGLERANPLARLLYPTEDEAQAVALATRGLGPSDPLYIGIAEQATHSVVNDVRAYWLAGRPAAAREIMLMNGVSTSPEAERGINEDLENSGVTRVLLWHGFPLSAGWGLHLKQDSPGDVDRVIGATFRRVSVIGGFEVWERRPELARPNRLAFVR